MRAIKIDPEARTIEEIDTVGDLKSMTAILNDGICSVRVAQEDILWIGDEGLLKDGMPIFRWVDYHHPLAGVGLIIGIDETGDNVPATVALDAVKAAVIWTDLETTGELKATREYIRDDGAFVQEIGAPILRERK